MYVLWQTDNSVEIFLSSFALLNPSYCTPNEKDNGVSQRKSFLIIKVFIFFGFDA